MNQQCPPINGHQQPTNEHPPGWLLLKNKQGKGGEKGEKITSVAKDVEKSEPLCLAGGSVK